MNIFLNEYFGFWFELNFELNHFSARFNEKMNFQNVSPTPSCVPQLRMCHHQHLGDERKLDGNWLGVGRSCKHPYNKFAPTQPKHFANMPF